jgi:hypothetical protein
MPTAIRAPLAYLLLLGMAGAAAVGSATTLPGKGPAASECFVVLQTTGSKSASAPNKLECQDGDPSCDQDGDCHNGSCTFKAQMCPNQPGIAGCTPSSLTSLTGKAKGVPLAAPPSLTGSDCGATTDIVVGLKGKKKTKPGRTKVVLVATAASGKPKKDRDKDALICTSFPADQACPAQGPTTTSTLPANVVCEDIVTDGQGIPGTYQVLSVQGPKICQTNSSANRFGPCSTDADCGGGQGNCQQTPWASADGTVLPFPTGIKTVATVAAADPSPTCNHSICVACGNEGAICAGIPGCGSTPGQPAPGCIRNQCCDAPGFTIPTFIVPLLGGLCSRLDMYRCGFGVINTSNPQTGDNEVTKTGDTTDPGPDCEYGTGDDPAPKACNVNAGGAGADTKGKVTRTLGNGVFDPNGIHYRVAVPSLSTTWQDSTGGNCPQGSTFDNGELIITQIVLNAEFTTAGATSSFADLSGDGCARAGAGFSNASRNGPFTLGPPLASPQAYDGHTDANGVASTAVSAGIALSGNGPLNDLGFIAVLTQGPITRVATESCTCSPVPGCPE